MFSSTPRGTAPYRGRYRQRKDLRTQDQVTIISGEAINQVKIEVFSITRIMVNRFWYSRSDGIFFHFYFFVLFLLKYLIDTQLSSRGSISYNVVRRSVTSSKSPPSRLPRRMRT